MMIVSRWFSPAVLIGMFLVFGAGPASSYDVEVESTGNAVFVLLRNLHPTADFDSIAIDQDMPAFVSQATASIIPASVPATKSDLAQIDFDVAPTAILGSTGDITLTVSGNAAGQPIDLILTVPLQVAETAPEAQGIVGVGVPAPDPGGVDTDMDGVTDALEIAFGSDPNNPSSLPGVATPIPALRALGLAGLVLLLMLGAIGATRRRQPNWIRP